jgi:hypothetical protein
MMGVEVTGDYFTGGFYNGGWRLATQSGGSATSAAYHLVVTWNGTVLTLYRNGSSVATNTPGIAVVGQSSPSGFYIGRKWDNATSTFQGRMSDVAFWNTALSGSSVTALYDSAQ